MRFHSFKIFYSLFGVITLFIAITFSQQVANGQSDAGAKGRWQSETALLLEKVEKNQFNVRRVEYTGNTYTRVRTFRPKMLLDEGDIFTRELLYESLLNLSKLKGIYPVRPEDVQIRLDEKEKVIDLLISIRQKRRKK